MLCDAAHTMQQYIVFENVLWKIPIELACNDCWLRKLFKQVGFIVFIRVHIAYVFLLVFKDQTIGSHTFVPQQDVANYNQINAKEMLEKNIYISN